MAINWNEKFIDEWRQLRFHYDFENEDNEWKFLGSKEGLKNLATLVDAYTNNKGNVGISEHEHYGPYSYLKIMTWDKPTITRGFIAGTIQDLKKLSEIITDKINKACVGETFRIDKEYGIDNTATLSFDVMPDNFDPASLDKQLFTE